MAVKRKIGGRIALVILCFLLGGCASGGNGGTEESGDQQAAAYQATITQLQKELLDLRAEQLRRNAAYETRIAELEILLAESVNAGNEPEEQRLYSYVEVDDGIILTAYHGTGTDLVIPASVDGKPVIGIGESAFRNSALTSVSIPEGVRTLDWFAFYGSYKLASVTLPASVTSIAYGAFELCNTSLRITCPKNSYAAQYAESYGIPAITV